MPQCHNTYSKSTQYCTITITNWPFAEKPFVYWQKSPLHTPKKTLKEHSENTLREHMSDYLILSYLMTRQVPRLT